MSMREPPAKVIIETHVAAFVRDSAYGPLGSELVHRVGAGDRPFHVRTRLPGVTVEFGYRTAVDACGGPKAFAKIFPEGLSL